MNSSLISEMYRQEKTLWWHGAKRKMVKTFLERYGGFPSDKKVLDIGCGTGAMMEDLVALGADVYGIDSSPQAVSFCKKRNLKNIYLGNLERRLPFPDNFSSAVTCLDVLEHVSADEKLLAEVYRVLKPAGLLIISVPAYQVFWTYWDEMLGHKRRYVLGQFTKKLTGAGFLIEKGTYLFSFLVPGFGIRLVKQWLGIRSSDFSASLHGWLNTVLLLVCTVERKIVSWVDLPFGTSILIVAKKE